MSNSKEPKEKKIFIYGIISAILIMILWLLNYYLVYDMKERGTFGDMFGSVNALFSGLALAGIIFSILLQRQELGYQREELIETRKEFNIQNSTLKFQRFENTFFNLLTLHHQIIDGIDYTKQMQKEVGLVGRGFGERRANAEYEIVTIKGRDFFKDKYEALITNLNLYENEDINHIYLQFYDRLQTDLGHYFRNVYRIIKFVDETEFISKIELNIDINSTDKEDNQNYYCENFKIKYKYISMLRAQLSDYETLWLFYNCLSDNGKEKFKPYIEKYTLFKNLPTDKLHDSNLVNDYDKFAFEKNKTCT